MILFISLIISLIGFIVLALGMARHRKTFALTPISAIGEQIYLSAGLLIISLSLLINITQLNAGSAIVWWCGQLSLSALAVVTILTRKRGKRY
ncbi:MULTISPECIES: DUF3325 family protein [Pseudoalteromonas]|uniref:DUF3325 family protein n=1 Tax=Pseudoalteromonas haloplanktis TaxID=228 RepID=A0ABU1BDT4_PSEHA|nr:MULTISPECIES: DUF3325 family protein [Pseudoalteromonas]MCF6144173.1 hypothetical protein [Pseudoalteromonas mariniglutinosa NCIMB 1770]MDQ9092640.1 DUF3325 family protein [Pseudoalteromonas haloplanktis]TMN69232.1 DUF3325 domain-containing protein [Pseudoalteromonas sp. S1727]BDF96496.1 hypothetical protein KAN5_33340 [Pseudoalteromonas sp. KAN5]